MNENKPVRIAKAFKDKFKPTTPDEIPDFDGKTCPRCLRLVMVEKQRGHIGEMLKIAEYVINGKTLLELYLCRHCRQKVVRETPLEGFYADQVERIVRIL